MTDIADGVDVTYMFSRRDLLFKELSHDVSLLSSEVSSVGLAFVDHEELIQILLKECNVNALFVLDSRFNDCGIEVTKETSAELCVIGQVLVGSKDCDHFLLLEVLNLA